MKPILQFRVQALPMSPSRHELYSRITKLLKGRFADKYDIIVTPPDCNIRTKGPGADEVIPITLTDETDLRKFIEILESYYPTSGNNNGIKKSNDFHLKYMPISTYMARSFDGDPDVNPDDLLDQYWINMLNPINESGYPIKSVIKYLKDVDINPNLITEIELFNNKLSLKLLMSTEYGYDDINSLYIAAAKARDEVILRNRKEK
jgi:hypothetical protein